MTPNLSTSNKMVIRWKVFLKPCTYNDARGNGVCPMNAFITNSLKSRYETDLSLLIEHKIPLKSEISVLIIRSDKGADKRHLRN